MEWTAGTYAAGAGVTHGGATYLATASTSAEPPGTGWLLLIAKPADGQDSTVPGPAGVPTSIIAWTAGTYAAGCGVTHGGATYLATASTSAEPPGTGWLLLIAKPADGTPGADGVASLPWWTDSQHGITGAVDRTGWTALEWYTASENATSTDLSGLVNLVTAIFPSSSTNQTIDVGGCTSLSSLTIGPSANLVSLELSGLTALGALVMEDMPKLPALVCTGVTALSVAQFGKLAVATTIDFSGSVISTLTLPDGQYCPACTNINFHDCGLSSGNVEVVLAWAAAIDAVAAAGGTLNLGGANAYSPTEISGESLYPNIAGAVPVQDSISHWTFTVDETVWYILWDSVSVHWLISTSSTVGSDPGWIGGGNGSDVFGEYAPTAAASGTVTVSGFGDATANNNIYALRSVDGHTAWTVTLGSGLGS
jgi:hypothetical protein